jgi:hypothetical protein
MKELKKREEKLTETAFKGKERGGKSIYPSRKKDKSTKWISKIRYRI